MQPARSRCVSNLKSELIYGLTPFFWQQDAGRPGGFKAKETGRASVLANPDLQSMPDKSGLPRTLALPNSVRRVDQGEHRGGVGGSPRRVSFSLAAEQFVELVQRADRYPLVVRDCR